ncbi:MAG TPA: hypothetical protein VJ575_01005 [Pseudogulbenkiania sp.]|nr:hypothetical protein [Pseudogulbenkiania sp.]
MPTMVIILPIITMVSAMAPIRSKLAVWVLIESCPSIWSTTWWAWRGRRCLA